MQDKWAQAHKKYTKIPKSSGCTTTKAQPTAKQGFLLRAILGTHTNTTQIVNYLLEAEVMGTEGHLLQIGTGTIEGEYEKASSTGRAKTLQKNSKKWSYPYWPPKWVQ